MMGDTTQGPYLPIRAACENKLFSIVIATYNCGQKIQNTLDSIFSQDHKLFEVIIVDGASTDNTLAYIKEYEEDLTLISEKDEGIYFAFNKGVDISTGRYLYFIGAGDLLRPGILERVKEDIPCTEDPMLVYGKCYLVQSKVESGKAFESRSFIHGNLCQQGIFYQREVFNLVGKFELQYKVLADWVLNLKCFTNDSIGTHHLDYVIADYEQGGVSSEISCDPVFRDKFPMVVKELFGSYSYYICKAFVKNPRLFNHIYHGKFHYVPIHFATRYRFGRVLVERLKPYARSFQDFCSKRLSVAKR